MNSVAKLSDDDFDNLSDEAATWANAAIDVINAKKGDIPDFDEVELEAEGWQESWGGFPVVLVFEDGSKIYASSDPEGNDAGCLFGMTKGGQTIMISPIDDQMILDGVTS
jgi:hypothetical protein